MGIDDMTSDGRAAEKTDDGTLTDRPVLLIVAADGERAHRAEQAAFALGSFRTVSTTWADAVATVAATIRLGAVFADAGGVGDALLAETLPAIAAASDARLVIAFDAAHIDLVAAAMLPTDTILLCDASAAERTAALALAVLDDGSAIRDTSRDARRFQQINEEVARFAEVLARLAGAESPDSAEPPRTDPFVADPGTTFGQRPAEVEPGDIRRAIRARRLREDIFDLPGLFEDPAWDMLLDLFAAELERRRVSVSSLCIAAAVAPTTALRWIGKLIEAGLLDRRPDDFDRRRAFISLTARASTAMRNYVAATRRAGLGFA